MRYFFTVLCLVMTVAVAPVNTQALESPVNVVKSTTDQVLARVSSDRETLRADTAQMYGLVLELIFPHFDFPIMAQLVIREHWKAAPEATRKGFIDQFRKLLVRTYATALLEFSDQEISYPNNDGIDVSSKTVLVTQQIAQASGNALNIGYRLHQGGGEWKVFDVSIDGISLVKTYRASFASLISDGGVDGLVQSLKEKNQDLN